MAGILGVVVWIYMILYVHGAPSSLPVELNAYNITNALDYWQHDLAVMFYTPWCHGCKQFVPYWEAMSLHYSTKGDLLLGNLNCEEFENICSVLGVNAYPDFIYFGFGSISQSSSSSSRLPRCASEFPLDVIDYDAVMDWISMLSWMSRLNRASDFLRHFVSNLFSPRSVTAYYTPPQDTERDATIATLTAEVRRLTSEIDRYKALDLFDSLSDHGDPFPLLSTTDISNTLPLRYCVAEMIRDYCTFEIDEPTCDLFKQNECITSNLTTLVCRPAQCPFRRNRGCAVVSTCMQPHVLSYYKNVTSTIN